MDKMKLVREHISFERGLDAKKALNVGIKALNNDPETLRNNLAEYFEKLGFESIRVDDWNGKPINVYFDILLEDLNINFNGDKNNLIKIIANWLKQNTYFYLSELHLIGNIYDKQRGVTCAYSLILADLDKDIINKIKPNDT